MNEHNVMLTETAIRRFIQERGIPPTIREITDRVPGIQGGRSPSIARFNLAELARRNIISIPSGKRVSRSIRLVCDWRESIVVVYGKQTRCLIWKP